MPYQSPRALRADAEEEEVWLLGLCCCCMERDDAKCDDNEDALFVEELPLLLLLSPTFAMVDSSAHFRCDLGVMECCSRIVYPPLRIVVSDDVVMADEDDDEVDESCCGGLAARVAEARRASHGLRDDFFFDAGLFILLVLWISVGVGRCLSFLSSCT